MVRTAIIAGALAISGSSIAQGLKPFEFRGITTTTPRPSSCSEVRAKQFFCKAGHEVAGIKTTDGIFLSYDEAGLASLMFSVNSYDGTTILAALMEKYGAPCREKDVNLQNGFGARFVSHRTSWCFSDGEAMFSSVGSKPRMSDFFYYSFRQEKKPKVDF